jgi:hypothetical protein
MKQFKNSLSVTGDPELLEAATKVLDSLGYIKLSYPYKNSHTYLITDFGNIKGEYGFNQCSNPRCITLNLPEQWEEFKRLASEEVKEELRIGDWAVFTGENGGIVTEYWTKGKVIQVASIRCNGIEAIGGATNVESGFRKATPEEIEKHLISEAEKKGFVKGAKVDCFDREGSQTQCGVEITGYSYKRMSALRHIKDGILLTKAGDLPYAIESCKLLPSAPSITIGGKQVEFQDTGAIIHGKFIYANEFKDQREVFRALQNAAINVQGILVKTCSGEEILITVKQINEIANHFEGGK